MASEVVVFPPSLDLFAPGRLGVRDGVGNHKWPVVAFRGMAPDMPRGKRRAARRLHKTAVTATMHDRNDSDMPDAGSGGAAIAMPDASDTAAATTTSPIINRRIINGAATATETAQGQPHEEAR
eukprot:jgi/Tetstr1/432818/TSEL_022169.t1